MTDSERDEIALADVPAWTKDAVWYQIFPERFRNGDPSNDPTPESMEGAWPQVGAARLRAAGWRPTPWTSDWTTADPWFEALGVDFYTGVQLRRTGGDLQGVLDALPYLDSLGVTALYLNPLNDAPSLHKYDARAYRHVDPTFGPDPDGDRRQIEAETPTDPATWTFTAADRLLLDLLRETHRRGMRVVLDYSWNHTGTQFWAFQDVLRRGEASPYASWYRIDRFDDPATPDTSEFAYTGWAGVPELPELRKVNQTGNPHDGVPYDGDLDLEVREHVFAVSRRWLDPDGDGDPSDGVDGFRLDVAEMVPLGFWRAYRDVVKAVNPEAVLVGEIWWQRWPDVMMDPAPYLGVFDGVMHYRPFEPARRLVLPGGPQIAPSRFSSHIDSLFAHVPAGQWPALWTMAGSHDTPRLITTLANPQVAYKHEETPRNTPGYWGGAPGVEAERAVRLLRLLQFTLPGAPHVYYGDEVGMWGGDDPDNRRPMWWPDRSFEPERGDPLGRSVRAQAVAPDLGLWAFHRDLIAFRRAHADVLSSAPIVWETTDNAAGVLVYRRGEGRDAVRIALNVSDAPRAVSLPAGVRPAVVAGEAPVLAGGGDYVLPARSGAAFTISGR